MYAEFFAELNKSLTAHKVLNKNQIIEEYKQKYKMYLSGGRSEFESIVALGDAEEIACKLAGVNYSYRDKLARNMLDENLLNSTINNEPLQKTTTAITSNGNQILEETSLNISNNLLEDTALNNESNTQNPVKPVKNAPIPSKLSIYLTDAFYFLPAIIVAVCGLIVLTFTGLLSGALGFMYTILAWQKFEALTTQICAFVMALIGIAICVGFSYLSVRLTVTTFKGSKKHFIERKQNLALINKKNEPTKKEN